MKTEERNKIINAAAEQAITFGYQEHFDTLPKAQKIALIGIFNDVVQLAQSLTMYQQWFDSKKNE